MRAYVECAYCGEKTVFDAHTTHEFMPRVDGGNLEVVDLDIMNTQKFDDFMRDVRILALELFTPDTLKNGVDRERALKRIRSGLCVTSSLACEVLERIKSEMYLYERDGRLWEA